MRSDGIRVGVVGVGKGVRGTSACSGLRQARTSGSPKSMMDNSRPIRALLYVGLDDITIQPELCYGDVVAARASGE